MATSNRCGTRQSPGEYRRAAGAPLDDRERSGFEQTADVLAPEIRLGLGRGREQDVGRRIVDEAPGHPPTLRQERRRGREIEADEGAVLARQLDRPPTGIPERRPDERIRRQMEQVAGEPAGLEVGRAELVGGAPIGNE